MTREEYERLKQAKNLLSQYTALEEGVLQVLYAFEGFERFLLESGLNYYLFPDRDFHFRQDTRVRANVFVSGFLNAVTSLRDQTPKFKELLPEKNLRGLFIGLWEAERSASTAFRFCERLRNYAQHQTSPIAGVTTGGGWIDNHTLLEENVSVFVNVEDICKNWDIKTNERQTYLDEIGLTADVSLIFRETLGRIGRVMVEFRARTADDFAAQLEFYEQALEWIPEGEVESPEAQIAHRSENGDIKDSFDLFPDFVERANKLRQTFLMKNNEEHFVSNRALGHFKRK